MSKTDLPKPNFQNKCRIHTTARLERSARERNILCLFCVLSTLWLVSYPSHPGLTITELFSYFLIPWSCSLKFFPKSGVNFLYLYVMCHISRVPDQNGVSLLYIMLEIHHSGRKPLICSFLLISCVFKWLCSIRVCCCGKCGLFCLVQCCLYYSE